MPSLSLSTYAHLVPDDLPLGKDLLEVLGAQDAAEGGLGSEVGGVDGVLHGHHRLDGVTDAEEDNGVHTAGDRVPGEDLEERERERDATCVVWWSSVGMTTPLVEGRRR